MPIFKLKKRVIEVEGVHLNYTYSMFLSKSFYEFNIFLTSVNLAL